MDFVKTLKLDQNNLEGQKVINVTKENEVRLSSYNFLIRTLETYNNRKFENDELITEFIKINLPQGNEEAARKQWFDGIEYNNHIYKAWFATTGGMKKENYGFCDTIFIREDYQEFAELVESLISLGKFKELEQQEKVICINKDVLSRLSLITSDLITEISMPNIIVLPQATYHIIKDYKTVEKVIVEDKVDYNLIDYHFDDDIDVFDGGAIATPKVFRQIEKELDVNFDVEFAIIRGYGIGIKGMITKFDILKYLDAAFIENTEYCKKENDKFYLKDMWDEWQEVTNNTILLNESMVKLGKYFQDMQEYKDLLNSVDEKYRSLVNKLYITKINKPDNDISDYRKTNYQLINALALTSQDIIELTKQDVKMFRKMLKPYDCINIETSKKFVENTDYISLFYKQCVNTQEDEQDEEQIYNNCNNIVDKCLELININPEFVKLDFVKKNIGSLIEKKIRQLAAGKFTVKAKYQYIAVDPISYINYAMYREQKDNGLKANEFYSYDCNDGYIRTIQRNPCAAYSEIHNINFIKNPFLDNYLSHCKELIYFNQKSDILALLSSADCDGDACTVIDDPIVRDAVVTPKDGKYFITKNDGAKKELKYNSENRFISTYRASGNLIGKIALRAANVNNTCQNIPYYFDTATKSFISKKDIREELSNLTEEEFNNFIKEKLTTKQYLWGTDTSINEPLRDHIRQKFYDNEKDIYTILYNSMMAIDAPKTLVFPSKEDMQAINSKYFKKVEFLKYTETKGNVFKEDYVFTGGLLDIFASNIQKNLLDIIEKRQKKYSDRHDTIQKCLANTEYDKITYNACYEQIEALYQDYNKERLQAEKECKEANYLLYIAKKQILEIEGKWTKYNEREYLVDKENNKKVRNRVYKEIDAKNLPIAEKIITDFDLASVCQALSQLKNCTENFILTLFWKCFAYVNTHLNNVRYLYQEDENGDIEYLYKKYKRIEIHGFNNEKVLNNIAINDKVQLKINPKIRFKLVDKSIATDIKGSLTNGQYELDLKDTRVQVFEEFLEILEGKEKIIVIKIDKINEKSIGLICKV